MTFNSVLAHRVLDQIREHPETHNQTAWRCGTGMCFAGWAAEFAGAQWISDDWFAEASEVVVVDKTGTTMHCSRYAAEALGLPDHVHVLFSCDNTVRSLEYGVAQLDKNGVLTHDDIERMEVIVREDRSV